MALKVLVVEDSQLAAESLESFFKEVCGFEVFMASGGDKALELLKAERPPVVLLNLYLGPQDMSGMRILKEAKANDPDIIVYVLTGFNDADLKQKSLAQGARDYLVKPLKHAILKAKLDEAATEIAKREGG